jgi:predicted transcriptional regulator
MADGHVSVRLSPSQTARLDELARRAGVSRSQILRRLIDKAAADIGVPAVRLSRGEALDLLHEQARAGRTSAIVEILRREALEDPRERALLAFQQMVEERRQ